MDNVTKYLEINNQFDGRVYDIKFSLKLSNKTVEMLAKHIQKENPKTQIEFERIEKLKEYVIKTAELNDQVFGLIDYIYGLLNAVAADSKALADASELLTTIQDQSETIEVLTTQRDNAIKDIYDIRKNQVNSK